METPKMLSVTNMKFRNTNNIVSSSETPADEPEPIVEEPETPEAAPEAPEAEPEAEAAEVSEDERAEPDVTDEE